MHQSQNSKSFRHFAKHVFLIGRTYIGRNKAQEDLNNFLQRMKKSIITMNLSYSDIDKLKEKIDEVVNWEKKYAKFFKIEDTETKELKIQISALGEELRKEREEKLRIIQEDREKVVQLTESLNNLKSNMELYLMEKAKSHQRRKAIEQRIKEKVDVRHYLYS